MSKILIAYYSQSGMTKKMAEIIKKKQMQIYMK